MQRIIEMFELTDQYVSYLNLNEFNRNIVS